MGEVAVVLASAGRPQLLADAVQSCSAFDIDFQGVVSVPDEEHLPSDRSVLRGWEIVTGARGLCAQRNAGLDAVPGVDFVAFFDDDALMRPDYLRRAVDFLQQQPDILGLTGRVLLDGVVSGEVDRPDALAALEESAAEPPSGDWNPTRSLYGCNFVIRFGSVPEIRFDARLPLYSWLDDLDFSQRLLRHGQLAQVADCVAVHRGASSGGRQAHSRLGYSQVMNPAYLVRSGSFPLLLAAQQALRPVAKNVAFSVAGGSASWRRERLRGNGLAVADILRGRFTPERILDM